MSTPDLGIKFEPAGIAGALDRFKLVVPLNQRPYAWDESHVQRLYQDFSTAILAEEKTYFLGTIVLAHDETDDNLLVADGQQRLATTSILICAIRDYLYSVGGNERKAAEKYQSAYLLEYDEVNNDYVPKLRLNAEDNDFFVRAILSPPDDPSRQDAKPTCFSHHRLQAAADLAKAHVESVVGGLPSEGRSPRLYQWVKFLRESAVVISIHVPRHIDAYRMFETLNDRGLRASQIDILKNFLFSEAKEQISEIQPKWASTIGLIESIGDDELMLEFVRHFWITTNGPTSEDELAERFKTSIKGKRQAISTAAAMESAAADYVALLTPLDHPRFDAYGQDTRGFLAAITTIVRSRQIRPVLLAVLQNFEVGEAKSAIRLALSWSVRFLVAGTGGGGSLERLYGACAKEISDKVITTTAQLKERFNDRVPNNALFRDQFRRHSVSKAVLARYYLFSLEAQTTGEKDPQIGYFENPQSSINLEHVMPDKPNSEWTMSINEMQGFHRRLGNLALMPSKSNVVAANRGFEFKRPLLAKSPFVLTQRVATAPKWDARAIEQRQEAMADIVAGIWPI